MYLEELELEVPTGSAEECIAPVKVHIKADEQVWLITNNSFPRL
jgi:hypothetical protein